MNTVTTYDELDALPLGSAVLDATRDLFQRVADYDGGTMWLRPGDPEWDAPNLPATVLYTPEDRS